MPEAEESNDIGGLMSMPIHESCMRGVYGNAALDPPLEEQLERMLKPIWGMRVRISLFSVGVGSHRPERILPLAERALGALGPTGLLRNGQVGLAYVGPRPRGPAGDRDLERMVADRVLRAVSHFVEGAGPDDVDVVAVHCWLDRFSASDELGDELVWRLARRQPDAA